MEEIEEKCSRVQSRLKAIQAELKALEEEFAKLTVEESKRCVSSSLDVSDIATFFHSSTRATNDKTNKIREKILQNLSTIPSDFLEDPDYGSQWNQVLTTWNETISLHAASLGVVSFDRAEVHLKAGRVYNYDYDVKLYSGDSCKATLKVEFKYGASSINDLPQFLSLPAKFPGLFEEYYTDIWYHEFLPKYKACDSGLTEETPAYDVYKKEVIKNESKHPFFVQMKEREEFFTKEKHDVVNESITAFLTKNASTIQLTSLIEKIEESQKDKVYLLWSNGKFHIDSINVEDIKTLSFDSITNGNTIQLKSKECSISLLLRWRNHKGILNPAWQIRFKHV